MKQKVNEVYKPLFLEHPRYFILMGGRGAGRSTVASQLANAKLMAPEYFRCAIMRYLLSDIRNSIYREITDRAEENGILEKLDINDGTMTIKYNQNSINAVGFRKSSSDQRSKLKSLASYNCVIIEEADEIPEDDFMQLDDSLRTLKGDITLILLLNPPDKDHWIVKRFLDITKSKEAEGFYEYKLKSTARDTILINTNYRDNITNIAPQSIAQYENYKDSKPGHYWNMIRGFIPETVVGKIYNNWEIIDAVPKEARLERYGLDFGYTNDPTAIDAIYKWNGALVIDETLHQKGLSNKQIADTLTNIPRALVIADSAEPKSIDEIQSYGVNIVAANKGPGSVNHGIQKVQDQKIFITRRSTHTLEEYSKYAWTVDKDGNVLNVPAPGWDHHMDDIRYAVESINPNIQREFTTPVYKPHDSVIGI